jgi:hypothetical protein
MFFSDNGASSEFINRGDRHTQGSVPGSKERVRFYEGDFCESISEKTAGRNFA